MGCGYQLYSPLLARHSRTRTTHFSCLPFVLLPHCLLISFFQPIQSRRPGRRPRLPLLKYTITKLWVSAAATPGRPDLHQITDAKPFGYPVTMLTSAFTAALLTFSAVSGVSAHSTHELRGLKMTRQDAGAPFSAAKFPDVQKVLEGNARFQKDRDVAALQALVDDGQKPPFMMISCSDSR
jgi:hypothetical protein